MTPASALYVSTTVLAPGARRAAPAQSVRQPSAPPAGAAFHVYGPPQRDEALSRWRTVEQRLAGDVPLAASSLWTESWLQHFGRSALHEFLVLVDDAGPCGAALLTHGGGRGLFPWRERTRHLGTAGEAPHESVCVEHNQLLVLPQYRGVFHDHVVRRLLADKSWESLRLDGFGAAALQAFQADLPGFQVRWRDAPYHDLKADREAGRDVLAALGRSTRQNVRRLLRRYGTLELTWAESPAEAMDVFDELERLHQARWRKSGQPGAFHAPRFREFQRTLIQASFASPAAERRVVLFRARQGGRTIGCLMLLVDGRRLLDYLSGFGDFEVFDSPGVVTHALCMGEALARGFDEYDFLVGEKRHKANMSTNVNKLAWAVWSRATLRNRTIRFFGALKRRWGELRAQDVPTTPAPAAT